MWILLEQGTGTVEVLRQADDLELRFGSEGFRQAALDEADGKRRDVNADPLPSELLRGVDSCPAAAEWIEDYPPPD